MKTASIIYLPGTGGNFVRYVLSLSPETVPYYYKSLDDCNSTELTNVFNMSAQDRKTITEFKTVKDFEKFHAIPEGDLAKPNSRYNNESINNYYSIAIQADHLKVIEEEYLQSFDTFRSIVFDKMSNGNRIQYTIDQIIYIDFDSKYNHWVNNSYEYFQSKGQRFASFLHNANPNRELIHKRKIDLLKKLPIVQLLSMSNILTSTEGFMHEYINACNALQITPVVDTAIEYYNEWYDLRVRPFI